MKGTEEICHEHSGCLARITSLEKENTQQWEKMSGMGKEIKGIMTRLNVVLGAIIVAIVTGVVNLLIKLASG